MGRSAGGLTIFVSHDTIEISAGQLDVASADGLRSIFGRLCRFLP
jgi:hypothetical protein